MSVDAAIRRLKMLPIALLGLAALGACAAPASDEAVADPNAAEPHVAALSAAFEDAWNNNNPAALATMNAPDHVSYTNGVQDTLSTEAFITATKQMYPDGRVEVKDAFAVGDRIITHWTWTATAAPSTNQATIHGMSMSRLVDGKVVEDHAFYDVLAFTLATGATLTPPPGAPGTTTTTQ